jgi:RimJ/RimL family protein N-acetyltransferase
VLSYKCLNTQEFQIDEYKIVPIRLEDRYDIMKWRNEQMYHLRQSKILTIEDQDFYFENEIKKLFKQENPKQILFSFLENEICIGYGGLVHINWVDKNSEISFIINTELEEKYFHKHWETYLSLIEELSFNVLHLHKIFVYAFDIRVKLYDVLERALYIKEARLNEHTFFNEKFIDVLIYSKFNNIEK